MATLRRAELYPAIQPQGTYEGHLTLNGRTAVECPVVCRFLGRLDDEAIPALRRQASEKRQGTKSREVGQNRRSRLYGDLTAGLRMQRAG